MSNFIRMSWKTWLDKAEAEFLEVPSLAGLMDEAGNDKAVA